MQNYVNHFLTLFARRTAPPQRTPARPVDRVAMASVFAFAPFHASRPVFIVMAYSFASIALKTSRTHARASQLIASTTVLTVALLGAIDTVPIGRAGPFASSADESGRTLASATFGGTNAAVLTRTFFSTVNAEFTLNATRSAIESRMTCLAMAIASDWITICVGAAFASSFAIRAEPARRAQLAASRSAVACGTRTFSGDVIARRLVVASTNLGAIFAVISFQTGSMASFTAPARSAMAHTRN